MYQQLSFAQSELAAAQNDMLALTSQIETLDAAVTEYENEKAALEQQAEEEAQHIERNYAIAEKISD